MPPRTEPFLSDMLRAATTGAHAQLETTLDLLAPPLLEARFRRVLEGFYGFHLAWEPALAQHPVCAELLSHRGRLELLRGDLLVLGLSDPEIDALAPCASAAELCTSPAGAIGSFYVMEGSTMGGQVIGRALAKTAWAQPGGLRYFNPYGQDAGARWRAFKTWLDRAAPREDWPKVAAGSLATFETLRLWFESRP